jgi:DNA-binding MarR family transcriptional regulator
MGMLAFEFALYVDWRIRLFVDVSGAAVIQHAMFIELDDVAHDTRSPRALEKCAECRLAGLIGTQHADQFIAIECRHDGYAVGQRRQLLDQDGAVPQVVAALRRRKMPFVALYAGRAKHLGEDRETANRGPDCCRASKGGLEPLDGAVSFCYHSGNIVPIRQQIVNNREQELSLLIADIFEAAGHFRRIGEAIAGRQEQTQARWQLLSVASGDPHTVPDAARRLGISRQAVQRVANDLVEAGLLRFAENRDHRTSPLLELTTSGTAVLVRMTRDAAALHRRLVPSLSAGRIAAARTVLCELSAALGAEE